MTTNSSSTAAATSDLAARVSGAVRQTAEGRSTEEAARIGRLRQRIQSLESRGFIRRQQFSAPTTGDFERLMLCKKG
jgi:hypothetical protein